MSDTLEFSVWVNGAEIALFPVKCTFAAGRINDDMHHYEIGSFESDAAVTVEIRSSRDLSQTVLLPENAIEDPKIGADVIQFHLSRHGTYIFEPDGYRNTPLVLFFNPVETNVPDRNDPKVHWFGPGLHKMERIELHSGETLYLAAGAIVEACLFAQGDNITVCGRGILTQRALPRSTVPFSLDFKMCSHLILRDFIAADPCMWNVVLRDCRDVLIDDVKVCGGRMINDDGIDICNSSDVVIRNCFVRAQDDIITPKGLFPCEQKERDKADIEHYFETNARGIRNVLVENCVFWCDAANVFRIGYECTAETMADITVRNCDIVHVADVYRPPTEFWTNTVWYIQPSHRMAIRNLLFEDLRIYVDVPDLVLMRLTPMECGRWVDFGRIENCVFRNVSVTGSSKTFRGEIYLEGHDAEHDVSGVHFENFTVFGRQVSADYPHLLMGDFVKNITFSK